MSDSKVDNNYVRTALASDNSTSTEPLRVDPVTSRLLVDIEITTSTTPPTLSGKRDDNYVPTAYALTDDANETLTPLIIDNRSGYLWVDMILE